MKGPETINSGEGNLSAVRRDFSVLVIGSGLGILFGFEPILSPVSIDESDDPPVIIAVRFR
jgi:hypothetical protein